MKWRKHWSNERDKLASKLIRKKFGAEGYGIYQALKEVIAENVDPDNIPDWGSVDAKHEIETLADECATTPERLKEFLTFCNTKKIFEKKEGKLFSHDMLEELDDYSNRLRTKSKQYKQTSELQRSESDFVHPEDRRKKIEDKRIEEEKKEEKNIDISGKSPIKNSIGEVLQNYQLPKKANKGMTKDWQIKAFKYANDLGIKLDGKNTGRFLKPFKEESEGTRKVKGSTDQAYSYLKDYEGNLTNDELLNFFFSIYENGLQQKILSN